MAEQLGTWMGIEDGKGIERRRDTRPHGNMNKEHRVQTMMDDGNKETSTIRGGVHRHEELEGSWKKGRREKEQLLCPDHTSVNTQN
jgi:hypothetical protein